MISTRIKINSYIISTLIILIVFILLFFNLIRVNKSEFNLTEKKMLAKVEIDENNEHKASIRRYYSKPLQEKYILYGDGADEELTGGFIGSFSASNTGTSTSVSNNQIYLKEGDTVSAEVEIKSDSMYEESATIAISKIASTEKLDDSDYIRDNTRGGVVSRHTISFIVKETGFYNIITKNASNYSNRYSKFISIEVY